MGPPKKKCSTTAAAARDGVIVVVVDRRSLQLCYYVLCMGVRWIGEGAANSRAGSARLPILIGVPFHAAVLKEHAAG